MTTNEFQHGDIVQDRSRDVEFKIVDFGEDLVQMRERGAESEGVLRMKRWRFESQFQ